MMSVSLALEDVERAFRHLVFSIKLMCYCELGHMDLEKFDSDTTIHLPKENVSFTSGHFNSPESVVHASQALVGVSFGISAIVLDAAFEVAGITLNPNADTANDNLRTFVYMVRCAFAHNPALPTWEARGDFKRAITLNVSSGNQTIDMERLHALPFDYEQIGGLSTWLQLRRTAEQIIHDA